MPLQRPELPSLGVGTWAWGDRRYWGFGRSYGEAEVRAAFQTSVEAGITLFDTAEIYGRGVSERLLGQFARETEAPVLVATKFFPFPWRLPGRQLEPALRASLGRLGLPRVDLYQIHVPLPLVPAATWAPQLAEVVQKGLTRAVGVSNYGLDAMLRVHDALEQRGVPLTSNQVAYSLLHREPERSGLLARSHEMGIALIAHSPLAGGLLGGCYRPGAPPPGIRGIRSRGDLARADRVVTLLREIGCAHDDKTPAQVALNWLLCKGATPIPGAKSARQAHENAGARGWRLSAEEMAAIDRASA